jgi:hypothetical protein
VVLTNTAPNVTYTPNTVVFQPLIGYAPASTDMLFLIDQQGTQAPLNNLFQGLPDGSQVLLGSYLGTLSYFGNAGTNSPTGGNDVVLFGFQPTPEPAHVFLLCAAGFGAAAAVRRRFGKRA